MSASLVQLSISPGGMPKLPIRSASVTREGVAGDWQKNRKYHGGPGRAVCLYSAELYDWLRTQNIDLPWGALGENFTTRGFDLCALENGTRLRIGACLIEITAIRVPCRNLNQWDKRLLKLIVGRSGWIAKVVEEGPVEAGDPIQVINQRNVRDETG